MVSQVRAIRCAVEGTVTVWHGDEMRLVVFRVVKGSVLNMNGTHDGDSPVTVEGKVSSWIRHFSSFSFPGFM